MSVNIAVNIQSSIRIRGSKTLYFDPWQIDGEPHDGDYVFITHEHYDHFSPEDIMKAIKPAESTSIKVTTCNAVRTAPPEAPFISSRTRWKEI